MDFKNVKSLSNVHYLWSPDFLNFDDIFKIDRVRGGLQSDKIKKPPGMIRYVKKVFKLILQKSRNI